MNIDIIIKDVKNYADTLDLKSFSRGWSLKDDSIRNPSDLLLSKKFI